MSPHLPRPLPTGSTAPSRGAAPCSRRRQPLRCPGPSWHERIRIGSAGLLPLLLLLAGCIATGGGGGGGAGAPSVVAADGVLCDLTRTLAGSDVEVACLMEGGEDPHSFALRPAQRQQLEAADLVLINGLGLTPALDGLRQGRAVIPVAERAAIEPLRLSESDRSAPAHSGHSHGHGAADVHARGALDPHVWHDPRNTAAMATVVAEQLVAINPEAREAIERRTTRARQIFRDLDGWTKDQIATVPPPRRLLPTPHRGFATIEDHYGLRELPLLDVVSGSDQMRPMELERLRTFLRRQDVPALFSEQDPPGKGLRAISARSGLPLAPEPLAADGVLKGRSLVGTFVHNTCTVADGLGGRCDRAGGEALLRRWRRIEAAGQ